MSMDDQYVTVRLSRRKWSIVAWALGVSKWKEFDHDPREIEYLGRILLKAADGESNSHE